MNEDRKILEFEIAHSELVNFMENSRPLIINEIVSAEEVGKRKLF